MTALWAIARHTLLLSIRSMAAIAVLVTTLIGIVLIALFLEGDNTLLGLLRVIITWSFGLTSFVLMLLVLYSAASVLDSEIVGKQITLLDTKPVPRWQILLGKWIGLSTLVGALLLASSLFTYLALQWRMANPPTFRQANATRPEAAAEDSVTDAIDRQLWSSRRSWRPRFYDAEIELERFRADAGHRGRTTPVATDDPEFLAHLAAIERNPLIPLAFGESQEIIFSGLRQAAPDSELTIRYRVYGRRGDDEALQVQHRWTLVDPHGNAPTEIELKSRSGITAEFHASARFIGPDSTLRVILENRSAPEEDEAPARLIIPTYSGIELLIPTGSFEGNFVRGTLLLWIRLIMLAGIGIAANTFVRGPVTAFLLLGVILAGSLNNFVYRLVIPPMAGVESHKAHDPHTHEHDQHAHDHGHQHEHTHDHAHDGGRTIERGLATEFLRSIARFFKDAVAPTLLRILPDFDATQPAPDLLVAREIGWARIAGQSLLDIGVRAGLFWLIGLFCFQRREVGLPI